MGPGIGVDETIMDYLQAKIELTTRTPTIPFKLIAIEAAVLIALVALLVRLFT